jgi:antitoxin PrlF
MPATVLELESTLTDRYQTTVPEGVRRVLKLGKRDKLRYVVQPDGSVVFMRAEHGEPVLGKFLHFLANDIVANPQHARGLDAGLVTRVRALSAGVTINLDEPLSAEDE